MLRSASVILLLRYIPMEPRDGHLFVHILFIIAVSFGISEVVSSILAC